MNSIPFHKLNIGDCFILNGWKCQKIEKIPIDATKNLYFDAFNVTAGINCTIQDGDDKKPIMVEKID